MRIDRRDLKWRARDAMRAACPNARFMTFLYLLLTTGLGGVASWFVADPVGNVLHLYGQGVALDRALPLALIAVGRMGIFLNILMAVFGVVINFGYKIWCLNTARSEPGELGDLFSGFSMVGRILWLRVLILVYGFLWYVAIFMPMGLLIVLVAGMSVVLPMLGVPLLVGAFLLAFALWFSRIARYAMAVYCLSDESEMGASWALRRSRRMMEGHVKDYFLLQLSFVGWYLLSMLIVTVVEHTIIAVVGGPQLLMSWDIEAIAQISSSTAVAAVLALAAWPLKLWLMPYITMTECNFYDKIKGGAESTSI